MRTVAGPTDRVVIVGAGLGGLSCALHLAGAGREVTILERERGPGGRAGRISVSGFEFDTGPTVLTAPELVAQALGAVGENLDDWLQLTQLDPAYRAFFPDGSRLDVISDPDRMAELVQSIVYTLSRMIENGLDLPAATGLAREMLTPYLRPHAG